MQLQTWHEFDIAKFAYFFFLFYANRLRTFSIVSTLCLEILMKHEITVSVRCLLIVCDFMAEFNPSIRMLFWQKLYRMPSKIAQIRLVSSHPEVYEPCDDSFALVDALLADRTNLLEHQPTICMEIGCGSGYVITSLALILEHEGNGAYYIATDINPHAVRVTRETLEAHGVHAELISTDIASGLEERLAGLVDVMVVNPPYVPTPEDEVGRVGIASAWAGGENGRSVIDKILPIADNLLSDKGWLYMVLLTANNPSEICLQMRGKGYASRIVVQRSTEEESLHIVKFWRDFDIQVEPNEMRLKNRTGQSKATESFLSQISRLSFWRRTTDDCS